MKLYVETDKGIICLACPRACNLSSGRGYCGVRSVKDGKFSCDVCELVSSIANDPIEKKPVFHYLLVPRCYLWERWVVICAA